MEEYLEIEATRIDWQKPVQWNNGMPAKAERSYGHIIVWLDDKYPPQLNALLRRRHFQDSVIVHEDTGVPVTTLAEYAPGCWIENVPDNNREPHPIETIAGTF